MTVPGDDELKSQWFRLGWDAAVKEVKLQLEHGQLVRFLKEQERDQGETE